MKTRPRAEPAWRRTEEPGASSAGGSGHWGDPHAQVHQEAGPEAAAIS